MYSKDKRRYAAQAYPDSEKSRDSIWYSLSILKRYEAIWGMDFTLAPIEVLQPAFNQVVSITSIGATTTLRRLKQYAFWRRAQGLPCGDGVFELVVEPTVVIRDSMVASPEGLYALLNVAFDAPHLETVDIVYRVFLWMGFSGLEDRQAVSVTARDVDLKRMRIQTTSGDYPLYDESMMDFYFACHLAAFRRGNKTVPRADGDSIMRGRHINRKANTAAMLANTIRPTLARKLAAAVDDNRDNPSPVALDTSYGKVYLSGVFYRLYERERHGHPPDFDDYAVKAFNQAQAGDKPYRVSIHNPRAAVLLRLRKAVATDYANWKRAFGLEQAAPKDQ